MLSLRNINMRTRTRVRARVCVCVCVCVVRLCFWLAVNEFRYKQIVFSSRSKCARALGGSERFNDNRRACAPIATAAALRLAAFAVAAGRWRSLERARAHSEAPATRNSSTLTIVSLVWQSPSPPPSWSSFIVGVRVLDSVCCRP